MKMNDEWRIHRVKNERWCSFWNPHQAAVTYSVKTLSLPKCSSCDATADRSPYQRRHQGCWRTTAHMSPWDRIPATLCERWKVAEAVVLHPSFSACLQRTFYLRRFIAPTVGLRHPLSGASTQWRDEWSRRQVPRSHPHKVAGTTHRCSSDQTK